jgi:hypothetical protein
MLSDIAHEVAEDNGIDASVVDALLNAGGDDPTDEKAPQSAYIVKWTADLIALATAATSQVQELEACANYAAESRGEVLLALLKIKGQNEGR